MRVFTSILFISLSILLVLPGRAWAPTDAYPFTGKVISISVGEEAVTGDPWGRLRLQNTCNTSNDDNAPDPDADRDDGDIRF